MSVLLQISDTHFGAEQPQVVEALLALAARQRPQLVVLSGDITQRARPTQFRAAKAFVDRIGAPVLAIPGNHDIPLFDLWKRLTRPYARYAKVFGTDLEPAHSSRDLLVLGVNTTRAWRHKNGEVCTAQIDRVAQRLSVASPQQLRVVVVHQPVAVTAACDRPDLLRGHPAALPPCGPGRPPGPTSCWVGTSICPTRWRSKVWRGDCGWSRQAPPFHRAHAPGCPTRYISCAGARRPAHAVTRR